MARLELHDVPEHLLSRLRERAAAHGQTVESSALECIERTIEREAEVRAELERVRRFRDALGPVIGGDGELRAARDWGRS